MARALLLAGALAQLALLYSICLEAEPLRRPLDDISTWNSFLLEGSIEDAHCDIESVQKANSEQLHTILAQLTNTTFFRLFQVRTYIHEKAEDESACVVEMS